LDAGEYDALVLAVAGLTRLGFANRISAQIAPPEMYPAVGQGAIGIECKQDDFELRHLLESISEPDTMAAVTAERSVMSTLRAGCHAPLGVDTRVQNSTIELEAVVLSPDGSQRWTANALGPISEAQLLGKQVADILTAKGAAQVLNVT
jgi:hydroxymethylbilane synthase